MAATDQLLRLDRHRITVTEYDRMGNTGVFAPGVRLELIDGEVTDKAPISSRHASTVGRLIRAASTAVSAAAIVQIHNPVRLGDHSEPEPDLMLLKPRADFYASAHPTAVDVLLLIEVADTSARYDRKIKLPLYARHGVCEVWIVDLDARLVRFFRSPTGDAYTDITKSETPGSTPVAALPGVALDLTGLLP
jgi:Uma2 family endonuclease